jgi:hypothetical protein
LHCFGDFCQRFQGWHGVTVFHAGEVATQQARSPFDITLRKTPLAAVTPNDFANIHFWLFFWHGFHTFQTRVYITQQNRDAQDFSSS